MGTIFVHERTKVKPDTTGYLVGGLAMLVLGLLVLIPSLLAYWHWMDENRALREKLEEMGLEEIPGVNLEDTARSFLTLSIAGCLITAAGGVLISVAFMINRRTKGSGPRTGESP